MSKSPQASIWISVLIAIGVFAVIVTVIARERDKMVPSRFEWLQDLKLLLATLTLLYIALAQYCCRQ